MSTSQEALRDYVAKSRAQLQQLLQRLNWTEEGVQKLHRSVSQPDEVVVEQLPPSCCSSAEHSVQLNAAVLQQLLPGKRLAPVDSFADLQLNYSSEEKLILYEHVLSCTPRQRLSFEQQADFAELVAETKRAHKRARRHRKSKMTLLEEMQQLVHLQMQALKQQQQQRVSDKDHSEWRKPEKRDGRRKSRSRSRSRSRKMKKSRKSRSRSNHRTSHNPSKSSSSRKSSGNSSNQTHRSSRTPDRRRGRSRSRSPSRRHSTNKNPKYSRRHSPSSSKRERSRSSHRRDPISC
ncbi:serine/arginine repetitive matrix protein 5 [Drosophila navojoa]|uniref:serine/arginine repetitive matrix protein 5 n=1 Tax=Drosophila navojoa TaxID=7232 RepID=UPI0011BD5165|nr:serine/arginine repetitive matrix protein 5 [Drosophila navojoa]